MRARSLDTPNLVIEESQEVQFSPPTETQPLLPGADGGKPDFYGTTTR